MLKNIPARCFARRFTLLEILIVFALLLAIGGLVTIQYGSAISHAHFEADLKGMRALLRSVDEGLWVGFDPMLTFSEKGKGVHVRLEESSGAFKKQDFDYTSIKRISFEGEELPFTLRFGAKGMIYPKGTLLIEGEETVREPLQAPFMAIRADGEGELPYPEWVRVHCKK